MIAALCWNENREWVADFCKHVGIELDDSVTSWLHESSEAIMERRAARRTPEGRRAKNVVRKYRRVRMQQIAQRKRGKEDVHEDESVPVVVPRDVTGRLTLRKKAPPVTRLYAPAPPPVLGRVG
jgi:hypothetical protein